MAVMFLNLQTGSVERRRRWRMILSDAKGGGKEGGKRNRISKLYSQQGGALSCFYTFSGFFSMRDLSKLICLL